MVERLASEGHPISPGAVGENFLIDGLPWARVARPGARLRLGPTVLLEISEVRTSARADTRAEHARGCRLAWCGSARGVRAFRLTRAAPPTPAQVTSPCATTKSAFTKGNNSLMDERKYPGCSRWYARVLVPGFVKRGDDAAVVWLPPAPPAK